MGTSAGLEQSAAAHHKTGRMNGVRELYCFRDDIRQSHVTNHHQDIAVRTLGESAILPRRMQVSGPKCAGIIVPS